MLTQEWPSVTFRSLIGPVLHTTAVNKTLKRKTPLRGFSKDYCKPIIEYKKIKKVRVNCQDREKVRRTSCQQVTTFQSSMNLGVGQ